VTTPRYLDIGERLAAEVSLMQPGDQLPKERELAERFAVSRMTVRQALSLLTDQGRVYSVRGHGTFVAEPHVAKDATLASFTEDMIARGFTPGSRLLAAVEVPAPADVARALELPHGSPTLRIERLRLADDVPMCLETVHLPARLFPRLLDTDLTGSLYSLLGARFRTTVSRADQTFSATRLTRRQSDLLGVPSGSAALVMRRISVDTRGRLVEHGESIYRNDRYEFRLGIVRTA
jgi:DNA-binding GntR family transcriptional regulator